MASEQSAPTAVFLIDRQLYYKFLAPIVDELLSRGVRVICLHNYHNDEARFSGLKAGQFASLGICPQFPHGQAELRIWRRREDVAAVIAAEGVDYIYSLHGAGYYGLEETPERNALVWVQIQHGADTFLDGTGTDKADIFARYSSVWSDHFAHSTFSNSHDTGCLALNSVGYDIPAIRRKYALPMDKPVIVYFAGDHPRLTWVPGVFNRLWFRYIFSDDSWSGSLQGIAKFLSTVVATEIALVRALRTYASERDALLIIKSRSKRPLSPLMCSHADMVCYDESLYPSTNYELMAVASLVVCIASTAQLEAAFFGTPAISLYPGLLKKYFLSSLDRAFPKCPSRYARSVSKFINNLRLGDLCLPEVTSQEVVELFGETRNGAELLVDLTMQQRQNSPPYWKHVPHAQ